MLFNLEQTEDKGAKLGTPMFRLYTALLSDVDVEKWPVAQDATISVDVLKSGKKYNYLDVVNSTINPSIAPGESPYEGVVTLTPFVEGITEKSLQWIYDNVGKNCILVWERCSDKKRFIAGNPCSMGLRLSYTNIGKGDSGLDGLALQFQGQQCPEPIYFYKGPLAIEEDVTP